MNQNEEAMAPDEDGIPSTVEFIGNVFRAYTEHGLAQERRANNSQAMMRSLKLRLRMAQRAMEEADQRIGNLQSVHEQDMHEQRVVRNLLAEADRLFTSIIPVVTFSIGSQAEHWEEALAEWRRKVKDLTPSAQESCCANGPHGNHTSVPIPADAVLRPPAENENPEACPPEGSPVYPIDAAQTDAEPTEPAGTEPGCQHPCCVLKHPHNGPAVLSDAKLDGQNYGVIVEDGRIHPPVPSQTEGRNPCKDHPSRACNCPAVPKDG